MTDKKQNKNNVWIKPTFKLWPKIKAGHQNPHFYIFYFPPKSPVSPFWGSGSCKWCWNRLINNSLWGFKILSLCTAVENSFCKIFEPISSSECEIAKKSGAILHVGSRGGTTIFSWTFHLEFFAKSKIQFFLNFSRTIFLSRKNPKMSHFVAALVGRGFNQGIIVKL